MESKCSTFKVFWGSVGGYFTTKIWSSYFTILLSYFFWGILILLFYYLLSKFGWYLNTDSVWCILRGNLSGSSEKSLSRSSTICARVDQLLKHWGWSWRFGSDHVPFFSWVICRFQPFIFQGKFLNPVLLGKMSLSPKMFMTNPLGVDPNKTWAPKFQIETPAPQSWLLRIIPGRTDTWLSGVHNLGDRWQSPHKDRGHGIPCLTWPFNGSKWRINGGDPITTETWTRLSWDSIRQPDNPDGRGHTASTPRIDFAIGKHHTPGKQQREPHDEWQQPVPNQCSRNPEIPSVYKDSPIIRCIYPLTGYHILMNKGLPSLPSLKLTVSLSLIIDS